MFFLRVSVLAFSMLFLVQCGRRGYLMTNEEYEASAPRKDKIAHGRASGD